MAMVKCPQCGNLYSDLTQKCRHCGYSSFSDPTPTKQVDKNSFYTAIVIALFIGFCVGGLIGSFELASAEKAAYSSGYSEGDHDGYSRGYENAKEVFYQNGYDIGHEEGYNAGKEEGYDAGVDDGYASGFADGKEKGYSSGYAAGQTSSSSVTSNSSSTSTSSYSDSDDRSYGVGEVYVSRRNIYHSHSDCCGMKHYTAMSESSAKARGAKACGQKCCYG